MRVFLSDFINQFINHNGPVILLLITFFVGFVAKVLSYYIYASEIENISYIQTIKNGIIAEISTAYKEKSKAGISMKNTKVFVDNMLNAWKYHGIPVGRVENIGDICGYICVAISAFFDMMLLTRKNNTNLNVNVMVCVYVYTALAVIFFVVLRLWEDVINSVYKKNFLSDAITNYIDNQMDNIKPYVTIDKEAKAEQSEAKQSAKKQSEVKQSEVKQSEVKQSEVKQSEVKQSEVKQSEVKTEEAKQNKVKTDKVTTERQKAHVKHADKQKDYTKGFDKENNVTKNIDNAITDKENSNKEIRQKNQVNNGAIADKENVITQVLDEYLA